MTLEAVEAQSVVLLTSGQMLRINTIILFPAEIVARIAALRSSAAVKLGGVTTGLGFMGSPGWAIGASAALGLLEGVLSNAARTEGVRLLKEADEMSLEMSTSARHFPVGSIKNCTKPYPMLWEVTESAKQIVNVSVMGWHARNAFLQTHGMSKSDIVDGCVAVPALRSYVHNGDEFLSVGTDVGEINIKWSYVVAYVGPIVR